MSQIAQIRNPWRDILLSAQASFRGIMFHVENISVSSGRRTVVHEYPKRNEPYSEDMGRAARRLSFTGYIIYRPGNPNYSYVQQRDLLMEALQADDVGQLIHPVYCPGAGVSAMCERFAFSESRERGGYTQIEMQFVEAGKLVSSLGTGQNTQSQVDSKASDAEKMATSNSVLSKGTITIRPVQE